MRARTVLAFMCALLLAGPVLAQEQRGSIEGIVRDTSGAVLPGVTVEAKSTTGATVSTTSDNAGHYRFPSLAPGRYTLTANLSGFSPRTQEDVDINLGQIKKVDFALAVAGVAESVQVTAESPLVDVKQTARQTNIRAEQVELLPKGRDFTTLVTQAPGANNEGRLGGLSIDGASAGENRYIIDGIETTDLRNGTSGKNVIADFVEEVQVKSSGYTAEFGGATGGVVNVVTKSGTNDIHGNGLFYFQGSSLAAGSCAALTTAGQNCAGGRETLRLDPSATNVPQYITYPEDDETRIEPGFAIGGPIVRDRAWFFGAYQPALTTTERSVTAASAQTPTASEASATQKDQTQYVTGNLTGQWSDNLRSRFAFNNSWRRTKGLLPALAGSDALGTNYGKTSTYPNYSVSGNLDWVPSSRFFVGARAGYYFQDQYDTNVTEEPRIIFSTGNNLAYTNNPALARPTGFQNIPSNNKVIRDQMTRLYFQADSTVYGNFGGEHQMKFGVQVDRVGNNVLSGESANLVRLRWDSRLVSGDPASRGTYGYYQVRSNGVNAKQGFITEGDIHTNNIGLFIQDAWTINNRLTINAGLRTERERVPTYTAGTDIPEFGVEFDFADKLAPRVGFAYDVNADGRTKVFGSWGVFYDIFKLELPRGSFGGDKWLEYYYTLDTVDWTNLTGAANCPDPNQAIGTSGTCAGRLLRGPVDFRHPSFGSDAIDPDLKPMRQQEATAGVEHQLNDVVAVSARYVHKQLDRAIEDAGSLDPQGNEIYIIANPGEGLTAFAHPGVAYPKAVRDYDSVEFAAEKRLESNWYLRASYLWSRLHGNYTGLSQSDEAGRTSPNVGRVFDYPLMMFQDGGEAAFGPLPTDRPHQFKAQFIYTAPFGTAIGLNQYIASGVPVTREIGIYPPNTLPVQYLGRASDGRTPTYSQTDLQVQHEFRIAGDRRLQLSFNVLNLFNQDTSIGRYYTYQYSGGVIPDEDAFYAGTETLAQLIQSQSVVQDNRFLMDNYFQAPIQARFGVKFVF